MKSKFSDLLVSRCNGNVYICNSSGQKMIINDADILRKTDDEIIKHYQSLNIFKSHAERRC